MKLEIEHETPAIRTLAIKFDADVDAGAKAGGAAKTEGEAEEASVDEVLEVMDYKLYVLVICDILGPNPPKKNWGFSGDLFFSGVFW